jgi:protein ImuB
MGRENRPVDPARMVGNIMTERRFAEPVARTEFVTGVIVTLFSDAARQLEHRGQGARMARIELFRSDGEWAQLRVESGMPIRDPQIFSRLLAEKTAGWTIR